MVPETMHSIKILLINLILFYALFATAQEPVPTKKDSSLILKGTLDTTIRKTDSLIHKKHIPRKAAIRSAIIPGWGQVYNGKYWKVPIVYAAIGIPAYLFFDNKNWYDRTKYAYAVASSANPTSDSLAKVHSKLRPLVDRKSTTSLINYRNEFRKNMDYSILFFLLFWALNIVDATVDAHLKDFDVSPDLSLKFKPTVSNNNYGLSLILDFHKAKPRSIPGR